MINSSFGGLLKDFRVKQNVNQSDVAYAMGWSEPSRLSRIEQGTTRKPSRDTIDKLCVILKLDRREKGELLCVGGYLPTDDEINAIRKEAQQFLNTWPYPAYLLDFAWRLIDWNKHTGMVYGIDRDTTRTLRKKITNSLELTFSPEFIQNKYLKAQSEIDKWHKVLLEKLVRFRLLNKSRTSDEWYQSFLMRMMKNNLFAHLWQKAQNTSEEHGIANYEHKYLVNATDVEKRFDFHIFRSPLIQDVRFEVNYHIPANATTLQFFNKK